MNIFCTQLYNFEKTFLISLLKYKYGKRKLLYVHVGILTITYKDFLTYEIICLCMAYMLCIEIFLLKIYNLQVQKFLPLFKLADIVSLTEKVFFFG